MKKNKKTAFKFISFFMVLAAAASVLCGCFQNTKKADITSLDDLDGKTIAYMMGASYEGEIIKRFPESEILSFNTVSELLQALKSKRIDAYFIDEPVGVLQLKESAGIKLVGEPLVDERYGYIFNNELTDLQQKFNEVLQRYQKDGTLKMLEDKWIKGDGDPNLSFDDSIPTPNGTLQVAVELDAMPFAYISNSNIVGHDIELLYLISSELGFKPELKSYPFTALLPAVTSGRADIGLGCITYTEERAKTMLFSDSIYNGGPVAMVRDESNDVFTSVSELDGKKIGYMIDSDYKPKVEERLPESISYEYDTYPDLIHALKIGKIDSYITDEPIARCHVRETAGLTIIEELLSEDSFGFILNQSDTEFCEEINEVLNKLEKEGVYDDLRDKWIIGEGDPNLTFDPSIPTPNGDLNIAIVADAMPFSYIAGDNNFVGYEVELIYMICKELGYRPVLENYSFDVVLNTINSGKARIGIGAITWTQSRAQSVLFTDSICNSGSVAVVLDGTTEKIGFLDKIKSSFSKNLIVEDRWKMVLSGLLVTIELSILSLIFGTFLGFLWSFALRSKNKLISGISSIISTVLDGLPLLIILMVFYYIVFAKTTFSAISIGVFGLSLNFANCVAATLNTGIKAIDKGQIEAAEAMGYSKLMVFRKIIFPQAAMQMFGSYSGSVLSLVKDTSIIGYIAVEDLTKVSDIIRSRTFEAFFPLIFTAIIYFIIARIFIALLAVFAKKLDPKHRARRVKGVYYND